MEDLSSSVVTITLNASLDKSSAVERVEPERKMRCDIPTFDPGGGGLNVSRAIGYLGGRSQAVWARGGLPGRRLSQLLDEEGLEHTPIEVSGATRENFVAFEKATSRQYRFNMPGAEMSPEEAERFIPAVEGVEADYVVASGSLPRGVPLDLYGRLARRARERGRRFVVDTSGSALRRTLEEGVYLAKPNLNELRELAQMPVEDVRTAEEAARRLVDEGRAEVVVVSMAASGALLVTGDRVKRFTAPPVRIASTIGAGDSMVAGMVLGLARGLGVEEAVRFGVAAGTAAVLTPGTQLCRREDAERLYEQVE